MGYRTIIVMPNDQSKEKIDTLKHLGAKVVLTEKAPFTDKEYIQLSKKIAKDNNAIWANQFDNLANRKACRNYLKRDMDADTRKNRRIYMR